MKLPLLFKQTAIRSSAIFLVKIFGLIGRIFLTRLVGAEGVGLYQIAYSYYGLILMIITGGLPTTLALFTAKNRDQGWLLFKAFSLTIIVAGGISSLLTFWFSSDIARLLGNSELGFAIRCIAPALFAVPLLNMLRGYLQGLERFGMIALSELTEQAVRIAAMLVFVLLYLPNGFSAAVGGGILGTFMGALCAFILLIFACAFSRKPIQAIANPIETTRVNSAFAVVFQTSLLIALTRLLIPASDLIDAVLIQKRLQTAGHSASEAMAMYGVLSGMAVIIVYMPTLLTSALSHTITMKIVADWQDGRMNQFYRRVYAAMELSWIWGWASGLFLYQYSEDISSLFFGTAEAAKPIQYLSFIPLIVGFRELTTSILWAQDRKKVPLAGLIAGICATIILLYFLIPIPGFGYAGAAIALTSMELVAAVWNLQALKLVRSVFFRPSLLIADFLFLAGIMIFASLLSLSFLGLTSSKPMALALEIVIYLGGAGIYMGIRFLYKIRQQL
ncbi:oligosaccharide flippase family protein [Cohnella mopanensis]|uniref:oligosaccharide flippase family protein n=1 Tax=Cohnella mopanensis TaxID=2911966 RepID=UPI002103BEE7|nr:oligosaccharide flippase family protein [Cohnella mopanensis]